MTIMLDMTKPGVRENVILIHLESSLAFYAKTGIWMGGVSALTTCWRDGWSHHRTAVAALEDIVACRRMLNPDYYPSTLIIAAFDGRKNLDEPSEKARKRAAKAVRMGDRWHKNGRPNSI